MILRVMRGRGRRDQVVALRAALQSELGSSAASTGGPERFHLGWRPAANGKELDVLVMSRGDFRSMVTSFPVLDDYFAKLLRERHPEAVVARERESRLSAAPPS